MQMKFGIVFSAVLIVTTGCKTLDSVHNTLGGSSPSAEQIQAAYNRAEAAYYEAQQAIHLANVESLADYDRNRVDKARQEWQELEEQFTELKAKPHEALDSASFFSSQTVSGEIMSMSQEILALVGGAQAAKKLILSVLEPVRSHFAVLDKFDTQQQFPTRYRKLNKHHNKLKAMLVDGKQPDVEAQLPGFKTQLTRLEKDAVSLHYLGQINVELTAISTSAKAQVLPSVYMDARNTADYAQQFINSNVRDYSSIEDKVHSAKLQILRLEHLFAEHLARKQALDDKQVEAQLLTLENQLLELTEKAGLGDLRHLSFANQLKAVKDKL
ncbi:hypothetical protein J8M20_18430 [Pseudoalteromonas luteoviolacea]|uniref:hypothetical protein n=1 Tax=Pseudoalteromonas luteoviolacea TaxID=43657 RepID=UPI001B36736D|nr:hypothetical protein [Pseudoalteromonas luteoviolacea]MBQ4813345.1 hypothetical protein [Pseudoalteromonas luteoviolacea]